MQAIENILISVQGFIYLFFRVGFGALLFSHGWPKLMNMAGFIENVGKMGLPLPMVSGPLAMASEVLGGILIILGFKSRIAASVALITFLVATFVVHANDPWQKKEFALVYALMCLAVMASGSGKFSIDKK